MAPPSASQRRHPQMVSLQPSTPLPQLLQPSSEVSMQMPNEASLSQLLDDPSTLPPSQKFYSHARRPRPVTSGYIIIYMMNYLSHFYFISHVCAFSSTLFIEKKTSIVIFFLCSISL